MKTSRLVLVPAVALLTLGAAQDPAQLVDEETARSGEFVFPVDLTEDLYHRILAELFVPDSEPLGLRLLKPDVQGNPVPAGAHYLRFEWEQGTFDVRSDRNGLIAVHMDFEASMSHLTAVVPPDLASMSREFTEFPTHPLR